MKLKRDAKFGEESTCRFKIGISDLTNFDLSTWKVQKKFCFNWVLVTKKYIVWARKVQTSYLSWHWGVLHILKKNWLVVWKKTWEFDKFSPEHLKVSELELWWDPFVQRRKGMTLKFTEELCVMTIKNNAKFEEELTFPFKTDMRNLTNFDSNTPKSKKIAL